MSFDRLNRDPALRRRCVSIAALSLLTVAIGCGSGSEPLQPGITCAELLSECLVNQKICVADGGAARCEACADGQYAAASGACEPIGGTPLSHEFETFTVQAGEEIKGLCQSWTLNNSEELWVNAVELDQNERSHHSIWTFVPDDQFAGPDGVWPCSERGYNELLGALAGGVLYAQSTQAEHEVQKFPNGAAVRIPPYSRVIGDIHLLNTTPEPVTGSVRLTLYNLAEGDVQVKLVPMELTFRDIQVPPHARTRLFGEPDLSTSFQNTAGIPFGLDIYYILPHTHQRGTKVFLDVLGGAADGERIFEINGYAEEGRGHAFNEPVRVEGANGFRFGCEYENTTNEYFEWGFNREMCQMLGFVDSVVAFSATVSEAAQIENDGDMLQFTGPTSIYPVLWDHEKPGGPGPMP
jgi:hypothetical protein